MFYLNRLERFIYLLIISAAGTSHNSLPSKVTKLNGLFNICFSILSSYKLNNNYIFIVGINQYCG